MNEHWQKVPGLITRLYEITDELERMFGRKFTPDGHLVGSLGEAIAVYMYELELTDPSFMTHDAKTKDGKRMVQVKFTAGKSFGIYERPDYLIALRLANRNEIVVVFNGPGAIAWKCAGKKSQKNGQRSMSVGRLAELSKEVPEDEKIPLIRELRLGPR